MRTRVTSFDFHGGWAELRAIDTADLAAMPESVEFGAASALPAAGVTALRLEPFIVRKPFGADLTYLMSLLVKGRLGYAPSHTG
jgi:NADPH:quinone reductase-like Zn-dependent oxidoreductase